ncbi:hypothetical protein D3C76_1067080 [compost metagenome]
MTELWAGEVRAEHSGEEAGRGEQAEADCAEVFRRHYLHQAWHQRDEQELRYPHPHDHLADLHGVVALDLRQV